MPDLSPKENYLRCLRHEDYEFIPASAGFDARPCGFLLPIDRGTEDTDFIDGFGVRWVAIDSVAGGLIPAPGEFILKDIARWKKDVTIPDVDDYPWEKFADQEKAAFPPDPRKAVGFASTNGVWERLAALMGFEEAMIAIVEEPEAVHEFFTAITDFKIKLAEKAYTYFKPDTFTNYDDFATERNLFVSPETYRALIKPQHIRLNKAILEMGMIPIQHTCGKAELCVTDYIETGAAGWNPVQPTNDIAGMLDKYGRIFTFEGGFDMNGRPGRPGTTVNEVKAEVERCFREYGGKKGYVFMGAVLTAVGSPDAQPLMAAIIEAANALRFSQKPY
jgi:hypothetical protein